MTPKNNVMKIFHPTIQAWFQQQFTAPTPAQEKGWPVINADKNALILAPTGSGKTLAAFLVCIHKLLEKLLNEDEPGGVFILYISPLKALNYDIEKNLDIPLQGIQAQAETMGIQLPAIRKAVRTGDTPQNERRQMLRKPPHLLITTPESLHLLLTSKHARPILGSIRYVIVDEIHALSDNKRGTFLSILLERLQNLAQNEFIRIGLSATQKPLERIAEFLGGYRQREQNYQARPVEIIDAGMRKNLDLQVISPVHDMTQLPHDSIWPSIYERLHELVDAHRSTLIFANNRAVVEKITANLNDLAQEKRVRSHHGSVSKNVRKDIENQLKAGRLPALAATATLELGIDMGAIDLVCQVESPHSVATGLQRVGRAGHLYRAASKGRLLPKMRADLLEMAALTRAMFKGEVAAIKIPQNCLDILAQQIVALVAMENWEVDALFNLIRSAAPFHQLPREHFLNVLEMLSGRYSSETFRQLKPRISWDRINNVLYPLPGSQRIVILNGGSIPESGQYPVYLQDGMVRLGELEEEFVYEARLGDNFQLGTNTWKILSIETNRVLVGSAEGQPAKVPFWKGGIFGRDPELSQQVGELSRELKSRLKDADCLSWLQQECHLDADAAWNLREYFKLQIQQAGVIPDNHTIYVESFRDELGDPRVAILAPFGRKINYAWRLALLAYLQEKWQIELESVDADSGILLRFAGEKVQQLLDALSQIHRENVEDLITQKIAGSALFGIRFRHNAGRALLLPRRMPGKRTPLYLLRMRSRDLLEVTRQFESFPIVLETYREILQDFFALDELKTILDKIENGTIKIVHRHREAPSPFCASLLFDFTAGYMYEYDTPKSISAQRQPNFNFEFLTELINSKKLPTLLDPQAIQQVEERLQGKNEGYQARDEVELVELLHRLGDLTSSELKNRFQGELRPALAQLTGSHRICQIFIPDVPEPWRWITTENFPIYRAAFAQPESANDLENYTTANFDPEKPGAGTPLRDILPDEIFQQNFEQSAARYKIIEKLFDNHTLVSLELIQQRYALPADQIRLMLDDLIQAQQIVHIPPDENTQFSRWVMSETLERLRRVTLKKQRKQVQLYDSAQFMQFLLHWQHVTPKSQLNEEDGVFTVIEQLQGRALPFSIWENLVLAQRIVNYQPAWLNELVSSGEIIWLGIPAGTGENRLLTCVLKENLKLTQRLAARNNAAATSESAAQIMQVLQENGACFLNELADLTQQSAGQCERELWDLIWQGRVTNDSFHVIRAGKPADLLNPGSARRPVRGTAWHRNQRVRLRAGRRRTGGGRWSLLPPITETEVESPEFCESITHLLLLRYGMICREIFELEASPLPWRSIYQTCVRLEWRGEIRRGYFVSGFSGIQFALPAVADELLLFKQNQTAAFQSDEMILLNSCDPANLYGAAAPLPISHPVDPDWNFRRHPHNYLVLQQGRPVLAIEAKGNRLTPLHDLNQEEFYQALKMLLQLVDSPTGASSIRRIKIEWWDGKPIRKAPVVHLLKELGFRDEFKMMVLEKSY